MSRCPDVWPSVTLQRYQGGKVCDVDTQLKDRAAVLLEEYKQWRPRYLRVDNTLRAQELIMYFVGDKRIN